MLSSHKQNWSGNWIYGWESCNSANHVETAVATSTAEILNLLNAYDTNPIVFVHH
jgi:hypothetical protein